MNRRTFLQTSSAFILSQFFPKTVLGQLLAMQKKNFLIIRAHQGMDNLAGLNPWLEPSFDPDKLFIDYSPSDVLRNIDGTQISLGPAAYSLSPFAKQMAVINGVVMGASDLGHPLGMQYITSGRIQETAPHLVSMLASNSGMRRILSDSAPQIRNCHVEILNGQDTKKYGLQSNSQSSILNLYKKRNSAHQAQEKYNSQKFIIEQTSEVYNSVHGEDTNQANQKYSDDDIVISGFKSGLFSFAQLNWDSGFKSMDNHFNYSGDHIAAQKERWDRLARLLNHLKNLNILENTLVMVVTEFTRTPKLNVNKGKDHNYGDNSVLLVGGCGLQGGRVIGDRRLVTSDFDPNVTEFIGDFIHYGNSNTQGRGDVYKVDGVRSPEVFNNPQFNQEYDLIRPSNVVATVLGHLTPQNAQLFESGVPIIHGVF